MSGWVSSFEDADAPSAVDGLHRLGSIAGLGAWPCHQGKEAMAMKQPEPVGDSLPLDIHVAWQPYLDFGCYLHRRFTVLFLPHLPGEGC